MPRGGAALHAAFPLAGRPMRMRTPVRARATLAVVHPWPSRARVAAPSLCSVAVRITRGTDGQPVRSVRKHGVAACVCRRRCTSLSRRFSCGSTARHSACRAPLIVNTTASRCPVSPGGERRRRRRWASSCPHVRHHGRLAAWDTAMPRAHRRAGTSRSLQVTRAESQTPSP